METRMVFQICNFSSYSWCTERIVRNLMSVPEIVCNLHHQRTSKSCWELGIIASASVSCMSTVPSFRPLPNPISSHLWDLSKKNWSRETQFVRNVLTSCFKYAGSFPIQKCTFPWRPKKIHPTTTPVRHHKRVASQKPEEKGHQLIGDLKTWAG